MEHRRASTWAVWRVLTGASFCLVAVACGRKDAPTTSASASVPRPVALAPSTAPRASLGPSAQPGRTAFPEATPSPPRKLVGPSPFLIDKKVDDVATGSLGVLSTVGVFVRTRSDELLLARLAPAAGSIGADGKGFSRTKTLALDRASGVAVYWVSEGRLVRRLVDPDGKTSALEVLALDASDGYAPRGARSSGGPLDERQDVVAYVAQKKSTEGDRRARVFVERKGVIDLSDDGGGASTLTVTAVGEKRFVAAWLDARSAMAPLHARTIDLDSAGEAQLGKESVPWIAPPSEMFVELSAVRAGKHVVAMVSLAKNAVDFGLAAAPVTFEGPPRDNARWLDFANGVDPAVASGARLCGQPAVAFVEPTGKAIDAPRALTLATVDDEGNVTRHLEIARGARIDHVDLWASPVPAAAPSPGIAPPPAGEGAVLASLDGRTTVRRIRCRK